MLNAYAESERASRVGPVGFEAPQGEPFAKRVDGVHTMLPALPLFPHSLSNTGRWYGPRPFGVVRTISWAFHRANIGPLLLVVPVVASLVVAPLPEFLVVDSPFLLRYHICLGIVPPNDLLGCKRSIRWVLRPCILLSYMTFMRVTRYVRGGNDLPEEFR